MGVGPFAQAIDKKIIDFIHNAVAKAPDEREFFSLAREIFSYQYAHNMTYRMYCMKRGVTPDVITTWEEIPPAPTSAFRSKGFCCFDPKHAVKIFQTSGTTDSSKRGKHYVETLTLYNEVALPLFGIYMLPDGLTMPMRIIMPHPEEMEDSSLGYMFSTVSQAYASTTEWYVKDGTLNTEAFIADLETAAEMGQPQFLLGPAFSFVHMFDYMEKKGISFKLPEKSRLLETGGFKGRSREITQDDFYEMVKRHFNIPKEFIVNEYGMTELTSQFYDDTLRNHLLSKPPGERLKAIPPWTRVQMIDPSTDKPVKNGDPGLIRILDLASRYSVISIQTQDVGIRYENGFKVLGRAAGAIGRGCSIRIDDILSSTKKPEK